MNRQSFRWLGAVTSVKFVILCTVLALVVAGPPAARADEGARADELNAKIERLIKQLGHDNYVLRERAQTELKEIGLPAIDALAEAQNSRDIEIEMRARYLMSAIEIEWTLANDPARVRSIMKGYGDLTQNARLDRVNRLKEQGGKAEIDALCRIVRFDESPVVSKFAAIAIMDISVADYDWPRHAEAIEANLANTKVRPAQWLRVYVDIRRNPAESVEQWKSLTNAEHTLWNNATGQTNWQIVQALLLRLVNNMESVGQKEETAPYIKQIVELQPRDPESIEKLVKWLIDKDAVHVVVAVSQKFPDIFKADPNLLYSLAFSQKALNDDEAAQKSVDRAQQLNPSLPGNHLGIGYELQRRGWFEWAEQEYRMVLRITRMRQEIALYTISSLSEMLHDQQKDEAAGKVLQDLITSSESDPKVKALLEEFERNSNGIRSRMHFFFAEHYAAQGDSQKQKDRLEKAIGEDPRDADALIGLYRFPDATDKEKQKTKQLIADAVEHFRREIPNDPEDPRAYNQFAWLVGNTLAEEDDQLAKEAINYSQRSLELRPNAAGYLDTLARCHYAAGNIEKAVEFQKQAARLEPHSGQIQRQLESFEKELATKPANPKAKNSD